MASMTMTMEEFYIQHAERYKKLVAAFKPGPSTAKPTDPNPDIIVSARIRPMMEDETAQGFPEGVHPRTKGNTNTVDLHELRRPPRGLPSLNSFNFTVDHVFGPESQTAQIYDSLVQPLVPWAWGGGFGTLFAYGQTGSGKTFTVSGLERHVAETLMDGNLDGERKIYICIVELAGQTAYDLLNSRKQISVLEDSFGTTQLAGAIEHHITTKSAMLSYIDAAAALRATSPTLKNDTSSRSHAICRIRIENPAMAGEEDGLLYLIDLAGSEAARDKVIHDTTRMKEAREINTSLSVLKDCIRGRALADAEAISKPGKKAYVPFRQSTLTKTLKHVFDPTSARSCKTVVVACVNPCLADVFASKNTLRFAELLRVPVAKFKPPVFNPKVPATWNNEELRAWIEQNSGTPKVDGSLLAPTESGPQLLRLPIPEFLSRCLKTAGVSQEQARAFHGKFWKLHVDSTKAAASTSKTAAVASETSVEKATKGMSRMELLDSSVDPEPGSDVIPFKQRIRPGMVISWSPSGEYAKFSSGGTGKSSMAIILSPAHAVGERVKDLFGTPVNKAGLEDEEKYLCAILTPAILPGAYDLSLWRHVVVSLEEMETEVLLEWDSATRYYYMTV
ncbi:kinesin-like protein Klp59C [Podospora fimiseda]|uniref:Kinesin-like protein Klp59C n=1 Tax=Podospora fimiseda TaxID=252190 RepID=A0AAN7GRF5_9PEZI|nr:kinesin-like protein Klp59C [Podospora fimiseda]